MSCEKGENPKLPEDAEMIRSNSGAIGVVTNDGSFDYTPEGRLFLAPESDMSLESNNNVDKV